MIQRPTRGEVLAGLLYLVAVLGVTWLALAEPYTYAYWIRFLILLPSSVAAFFFDYFVLVLLFGPSPTTWVADLYVTRLRSEPLQCSCPSLG